MATACKWKQTFALHLLVAIFLLAVLTTCKSPLLNSILDVVEFAVTPPVVSAIYPTDSSIEVPVNAQISITFSKNIEASSVSGSTLPIRDDSGNLVAGRYSVDGSTVIFVATGGFGFGKTYTVTITAGVLDTDENSLSETYSWTFITSLTPDTVAPVINALTFESTDIVMADSTQWSGSLAVEVTVEAADNRAIAQIMLSGDSSLAGATWVTYNASSPVYTVNLPAPGGLKHVYGQVKDGAGNISTIAMSDDIHVDITAPAVSNLLINDGASATNSSSVSIDVFAADEGASSGLVSFRYRAADGTWSDWEAFQADSWVGHKDSFTLTASLGGSAVIEAQVIDAVGHESSVAQRSIIYEQTPPTIIDVNWDNSTVFPYNGTLLRITFDEEMDPSSFTESSLTLEKVSDASPVAGMINLTSGNSIQNASTELWGFELAPNTSYKVTLKNTVKDIAGNAIGGSDRLWFFATGDAIDTSPPTGTVTLADPDGAGPLLVVTLPAGSVATDSATVVLDFSNISDDYNDLYGIKLWGDNDGMHVNEKFFEQDASWISWPGTNQVTWHLSTTSGNKYILYKFMDSAGNESPLPVQLKLVLDNAQDPVIYDVSVNNGETHTNSTDRKVDVSIQAEDVHSGIKEMMVSNSAAFTGASWQAWSPIIQDWLLPDTDGPYTFYVKVRDFLDEESSTDSGAVITLDRTAPSIQFNVDQVLVSTETRFLEGSTGSDTYELIELYGVQSYLWEKLSGPGTLYFNAATGQGTQNSGITEQEPYVSASEEGEYFIKITITDNAGNMNSATVPFIWDTTEPGDISNLTVPTYNTTGQPQWSWDTVSDADFYRTSYEADFSPYIDVYTNTFSPASPLADGSHTLYVRAQDNAGNSSSPLSALVIIDSVAPVITVINNSFIANAATPTITINYGGVDGSVSAGTGTAIASTVWSQVSGAGTVTFGSSTALSTTASASANDTYQLRFRVTDAAGNESNAYMSLLRDTTAPSTPGVTGMAETPNLRPTWYWSSSGGGVGSFRYKLTRTNDSYVEVNWTDTTATSYQPPTNLTDLRTYLFEVMEKDAASNWSSSGSLSTSVNTTLTTPAQITIGDAYPALRTVTTMTWHLLTGSGGLATQYRYYYDSSGVWTTVTSGLSAVTPTALSRTGLSQGAHSITVEEYFNSAWQTTKQATHTITVDTVAPMAPVVTGAGLATVTSGRTATTDTTPTWTWTSGGGGGNGKYSYKATKLKNADGSANGTVLVNWTADTTTTSYTPATQTEGTYQLEIKERDDAGNWSAVTTQLTTIDTTYPTMTSVVIRGTSHPTDTDHTYTRATSVSVDIAGNISSELNSSYSRPVKINMYDYNPAAWEDYTTPFPTGTPTATTITTTLPTGDGTKYVYIRLIDEAGNTTSYAYDTIILDTVAPTGTFSINNGAATTPSLSFYLTLSVTDNFSPASEIEVKDYDPYGSGWMEYRPYSPSMLSDFQFSITPGYKYTYAALRDAAGNEGQLSDSITLEVPVPTYAAKGQYTGGYTYVYYNPVTDPTGGTYTTRYYIYSTTDPAADPNNGDPVTYRYNTTSTSSSYSSVPVGELHYFFVRTYDTDTGGWGPYSATSVLGFSSNVTVVYDDDEPDDVTRATQIKAILTDTSIVDNIDVFGTMPIWSVTLLPEDLISNTYTVENQIYGDPVYITHGSTFSTTSTYDGRIRNIAASGKGTIAMGSGGAYYLYRVNTNWTTWSMSAVSPNQPVDIHSGNQMGLNAVRTAKTRPASNSDSIWYTPLYYDLLYDNYQTSSVTVNIFSTDVGRRGIYNVGGVTPAGGSVYAGDVYSADYYPVERQGEYCYFGYYEIPDVKTTGKVFLVNLTAKMDNY